MLSGDDDECNGKQVEQCRSAAHHSTNSSNSILKVSEEVMSWDYIALAQRTLCKDCCQLREEMQYVGCRKIKKKRNPLTKFALLSVC